MAEYVTLALLKSALKTKPTDNTKDALLNLAIKAASRAIEKRAGDRVFALGELETRLLSPAGRVVRSRDGYDRLLVPDIAVLAGLVVRGDGGAELTGVRGYTERQGWPFTRLSLYGGWAGYGEIEITAQFGWAETPSDIEQACLLQALRYYRRKDSPEGIAGTAEWGLVRVPRLDPDVREIVDDYRLPGFA